MDRLGLSAAAHRTYLSWLNRPHDRRVTASAYRVSNGRPVGAVSLVTDGRTSVDPRRLPGRTSEISILDESRSLSMEPGAGLPIHSQFEIKIVDWRLIPPLGRWVPATTHRGPVRDWDRAGDTVRAVLWGRDLYADADAWRARSWAKKTSKAKIIRELLTAAGFKEMYIPNKPGTTPRRVALRPGKDKDKKKPKWTLGRGASRLQLIRKLADSAGWIFFFTAEGVPVLLDGRTKPHLTLDESWLLSDPAFDSNAEIVNSWRVLGHNPRGPKGRVTVTGKLPDWHPQSPHALRFNGADRYETETIENSQIKTKKDGQQLIDRKKKRAVTERAAATVETFPIPCLDESTVLRIDDGISGAWILDRPSFVLPYSEGGSEPMTIGAVRRTKRGPKVHPGDGGTWQVAS